MTSGRPRLLASERHQEIVSMLRANGSLRIDELTALFAVSDETVRRDLTTLQDQGLLTRTRGGAVAESVHLETSFQRRLRENQAAKKEIARVAAQFVQDGDTIILDSGSTTSHLVDQLRTKQDLIVITNGINHVESLLANSTITVVITGGLVRRTTLGAAGELAVASLSTLRADHTFVATQGFSAAAGLTYPSFDEVAVKRAMIHASAEVTLLADGTKSGRASMVKVAPLSDLTRIVTSPPIADEEQADIRALGVELIVVDAVAAPDLHLVDDAHGQAR